MFFGVALPVCQIDLDIPAKAMDKKKTARRFTIHVVLLFTRNLVALSELRSLLWRCLCDSRIFLLRCSDVENPTHCQVARTKEHESKVFLACSHVATLLHVHVTGR